MQAGQLCSFTSPASIPIASSDHKIDHRALWAATRRYIKERIDVVKNTCKQCSIIGICQGGCVYNALDVYNRKNPAGCAYQRALWRHAIDFNETGKVRKITESDEVRAKQARHRETTIMRSGRQSAALSEARATASR